MHRCAIKSASASLDDPAIDVLCPGKEAQDVNHRTSPVMTVEGLDESGSTGCLKFE